jgi:hypothetical protein
MCAVGSRTTERVIVEYVGEQGKGNRWFSDVVTGKRLEIERLTGRLGEGRWKSTQMGNSLATYPTARGVLKQRWMERSVYRL